MESFQSSVDEYEYFAVYSFVLLFGSSLIPLLIFLSCLLYVM